MDFQDQGDEIARLYRQAFAEYGVCALWSSRPVADPGRADALAITSALRTYGTMEGRRLAERIEALCRAPLCHAPEYIPVFGPANPGGPADP